MTKTVSHSIVMVDYTCTGHSKIAVNKYLQVFFINLIIKLKRDCI